MEEERREAREENQAINFAEKDSDYLKRIEVCGDVKSYNSEKGIEEIMCR